MNIRQKTGVYHKTVHACFAVLSFIFNLNIITEIFLYNVSAIDKITENHCNRRKNSI